MRLSQWLRLIVQYQSPSNISDNKHPNSWLEKTPAHPLAWISKSALPAAMPSIFVPCHAMPWHGGAGQGRVVWGRLHALFTHLPNCVESLQRLAGCMGCVWDPRVSQSVQVVAGVGWKRANAASHRTTEDWGPFIGCFGHMIYLLNVDLYSVLLLLLLSADAHNHVDDYSGTLRGVRKTKQKPFNCYTVTSSY